MNDTTQAAADAVNGAPFAADLQGIEGLSEQDAGLLEQAASMLDALENDERNRGNCSTAEGARCSADAVRRLAVQLLRAAPAQVQQDAQIVKLTTAYTELSKMFHDQIVAQQAAWIEWQHGRGAEAGMQWIENGLCGPGHIPDEDEPYGKEAQAWFDANQSDPFPACHCGRPSNILWMGHGFCSNEHSDQHRAALAAQQAGGAA